MIGDLAEWFNAREQALIFWVMGLLLYGLCRPSFRGSLVQVLKAVLKVKIIISFLLILFYVIGFVKIYSKIGYWEVYLIKDTVFWYLGTGIVLMVDSVETDRDKHHFSELVKKSFGLVLILEYIANVHHFHIVIEVISVPIIFSLAMMLAIANDSDEYLGARKIINFLLILYVYIVLGYSCYHLYINMEIVDPWQQVYFFAFPILMTASYVPILYLFALYSVYEGLFMRLGFIYDRNPELLRFTKWQVFKLCHFNVDKVHVFWQKCIHKFYFENDKDYVLNVISEFEESSESEDNATP